MAARCAVCGKGPQTGFTVSHSHIRNKRTFRPNLQPVRTTIDGENVRVRVCVKCIKAGKVQRVEAGIAKDQLETPVSRMAAGVLLYLAVHKPCCGEWRRHE